MSAAARAHVEGCRECRSFLSFDGRLAVLFDSAEVPTSDRMAPPEPDPSRNGDGAGGTDGHPPTAGRYALGLELHRGGMGRIRKGWDRRLRRAVALKELIWPAEGAERRFFREAFITARLQHPAIVPVYDVGRRPSGSPFFAMRMVPGQSLESVIAAAPSLEDRLALLPNVLSVAEAVAYAHSEGIIHRDLKPANVLVGRFGETVVIDWGLAKSVGPHASRPDFSGGGPRAHDMTQVGAVLGTPAYMSPEQAAGKPADARSDVYALGGILYHLLTGCPPYEGRTREVLRRIVAEAPRPVESREPRSPAELVAITCKAMARAPADRYRTAQEFAQDLRRLQAGQLVSAYRYSAPVLARRWAARHRGVLAVAAVAFFALTGLSGYGVRRILREKDLARATSLNLLVEQGEHELLADRPERALAALRAAYGSGYRSRVLDYLFGRLSTSLPVSTFQGNALLTSAAFSPDGRWIAVGSRNGTVQVFDRASTALRTTLPGHGSDILSVAFDPSGTELASASQDGVVVVWDLRRQVPIGTLAGHQGPVTSVAFHPAKPLVLTASLDGTVRIWEADTGREVRRLRHGKGVTRAEFRPDGRRIVSSSEGHAVRVWDTETGRLVLAIRHPFDLRAVSYSPDGSLIAGASFRDVFISDAETGRLLLTLKGHTDVVTAVAFDPRGGRIASASEETGDGESVRIWDLRTGQPIASLKGHAKAVLSVAYTRDGTRLLTASHDRTARLWSADTRTFPETIELPGQRLAAAGLSPDGALVAATGEDGQVHVHDAVTLAAVGTLRHPAVVTFLAFLEGGQRLLTGTRDGQARVWEVRSGCLLRTLPLGGGARILDFAPRSSRFVSVSPDGQTLVWRLDSDRPERRFPNVASEAAALRGDGARLVTADAHHALQVWDLTTGSRRMPLPSEAGTVFGIAYSPDGGRIVTGGWDETGRVWDAETGRLLTSLAGHDRAIQAVTFSPDGLFVATASSDRTVKVWDSRTGHLLTSFKGHAELVMSVGYDRTGSRLLSASEDGTLRIWDTHLAGPLEFAALMRKPLPWRLVDGQLMPSL